MRKYNQFCGVARALDVVGERWTLLLIRDLLLGERRYGELRSVLPGLTTNLLAARLKHLTAEGIIEKTPGGAYRLTDLGERLRPVVYALGAFGEHYLDLPRADDAVSPRWAMVSLTRRYQGAAIRRVVAAELGPRRFLLRIGGEVLEVQEGGVWRPDATLSGPPPGWLALLRGKMSLRAVLRAGLLQAEGEDAALVAFAASVGIRLDGGPPTPPREP